MPQRPYAVNLHSRLAWKNEAEIKVTISNLPLQASTQDVWDTFHKEGDLSSIELYTGENGEPQRRGCVRFCPPPDRPFWQEHHGTYEMRLAYPPAVARLRLELAPPSGEVFEGPNGRTYHQKLYKHNTEIPIVVEQDLKFREISVTFPLGVKTDSYLHYRMFLHHTNSKEVWQVRTPGSSSDSEQSLVLALKDVPEFGVKYADGTSHTPEARNWSRRRAWGRITDILPGARHVTNQPLSLRKPDSLIDLGRWRVYRFDFDLTLHSDRQALTIFCQALGDFNTVVKKNQAMSFDTQIYNPIWNYLDRLSTVSQTFTSNLAELQHECGVVLPFSVRYMIEVCFSENLLNEYTLPKEFLAQLQQLGESRALLLLEELVHNGTSVYEPTGLVEKYSRRNTSVRKIPGHCASIRAALVTPTTVYFYPPTVEISNRVIRQYAQHSDRFLRVSFADERHRGKLYPAQKYENGKSPIYNLYKRIKHVMNAGIDIGSRHYDFLAFGNSQFRENGAYFFASVEGLTAQNIREWMGEFSHIRSISKYAARLGQCFSTTRPIRSAKAELVEIHDIKSHDHKYNFSDGCGRISKSLAQMAADETGVISPDDEVPSVVQFRLGGCKGVLAVHHDPKMRIYMRESQYKFHAQYEGLEIIKWSQFSAAHLNQQVISILSTLGVADEIFVTKAKQQIANLEAAMVDESVALTCLQREVDPNQMTLSIASMVQDGFLQSQEPFVANLLRLWRAYSLKFLKEKARIPVRKAACLLGCIDETGVLKGHYYATSGKQSQSTDDGDKPTVPEIFVQLAKGESGHAEVITGYMLLLRNPALHPGDIRVVRGVDHPALRHLRDTIVLPQTGDRDLSSMCAGGDLDGDDYVVFWDESLLPQEWNVEPMDYTATPELRKDGDVTVKDLIDFFVTYMENNTLGNISLAHLATTDLSPLGAKDSRCIELAALHSKAVDYPKSGQPAQMESRLRPKRWPHFMEKANRKTYHSKKILGQLYDLVNLASFEPMIHRGFDKRILESYWLDKSMLPKAQELKEEYDRDICRVMTQYSIATEFEVWSTFAMEHDRQLGTWYKVHEVLGQHAASIKDTYRKKCYEVAGGNAFDCIGPFVAAMYKVTNDQMQSELNLRNGRPAEDTKLAGTLISFPWLFPKILAQLAEEKDFPRVIPQAKIVEQLAPKNNRVKEPLQLIDLSENEVLHTEQGETHFGEELILFEDAKPQGSESLVEAKGFDEVEQARSVNGAASPVSMSGTMVNGTSTITSLLDQLANL